VVPAEVLLDGLRLGRRLNEHKLHETTAMPLTRMCTREGDASEMDSSTHRIKQKRVMVSWNRAATKGKLMRWIIIAAAAALVVPTAASAQPKPAAGCSQGELTRIRLSKIK